MVDIMDQKSARQVIYEVITHLGEWPIRSPEAFRNTLLGDGLLAINPMLNILEDKDVNFIQRVLSNCVAEGRMIDFGYVPNAMIKAESTRSREMFEAGEFQHPYDSWLGVSAWEGGFNGYYITPHPDWDGAILVVELYGVSAPNRGNVVLVYDMVSLKVDGPGHTLVSPAAMTYPGRGYPETQGELSARGANSLDPLVTMLRLLADASIPVITKDPPERLNRVRVKQGKWPIPGHTIVNTKDYVANFVSAAGRGRTGVDKGGTHASPIAHWRRAHLRHLEGGRVVSVKSSKVNWRDNEELHRLFYKIKDKK
jgi:hypothetical protein